MRVAVALALGLLLVPVAVSAEESAGGDPEWNTQDAFRVGLDVWWLGLYLPAGDHLGYALGGWSWGITVSFASCILQTPAFQLTARAGIDKIGVLRLEGKELQLDAEAGLVASFGSWRKVAPFVTAGATLTHHSFTDPSWGWSRWDDWGCRFGAGLHIRIGKPRKGPGRLNQFITPGVLYGRMFLGTFDYLQFQVALTGFMGF